MRLRTYRYHPKPEPKPEPGLVVFVPATAADLLKLLGLVILTPPPGK